MNCNEKDHKILKAIKAFRLARYVKQSTMAEALGINQTQYSRIEAGQRSLTLQHIRVISDTLKVPELLFWAMSMDEIQLKNQNSVLSQVLLEFVYLTENIKPDAHISEEELDFILEKIRKRHKAKSLQTV
jgi:transcriptional regulator with XRE-family HTH domain